MAIQCQTRGIINLDMCNLKKIISDITAFEPGTLAYLLVEHVSSVTVDFNTFLAIFCHKARVRSNSCRNW